MEFLENKKQTPREQRKDRLHLLLEAIKLLDKKGEMIFADDLFTEVSLQWGIRRSVFDGYIDALSKYVSLEKGILKYKGGYDDQ